MNILTRYVLLEMTKIFLVTVTGMTTLMILVGVIQEAIRENLTPITILQLIPYILPNALCFAIPGTMLFSACIVLGRISSSNELVAIKSMGASPSCVLWPVIIFAFMMSLVTVFLNDIAVSWGRQGIYRVVLHSVEKTIYSVLANQKHYQNGRLSIYVDDVVGKELIDPVVQYFGDDADSGVEFRAEQTRMYINAENNSLVFSALNGEMKIKSAAVSATFNEHEFEVPLASATRSRERSESPSNLPLRVMNQESIKQAELIEGMRKRLALQAAFQMLGGDMISLTHPRWNAHLEEMKHAYYRQCRLKTEPWRRWANGFSCLFFVFVGAPLAILLKRSDFWNTFALSFIPILIVYYPLLMIGVGQAKAGQVPAPAVWLGNVILAIIGWVLIKRVMQH